ncbi:hypothetical protein [Domibacillus tundrae]|uniref:hypothetical protein n=1 Tax=Domibacillus tundrae TaxID=1587527 RepID=UPI0006180960|nr:hypothetical protein [Domibacillus tundrae]
MKLHFFILPIVVLAALYIGFDATNKQNVSSEIATKQALSLESEEENQANEQKTDTNDPQLDPTMLVDFFVENDYTASPIFTGETCDIYTVKNTYENVQVQVDIYYERKTEKVVLVESNVDGSYYFAHPDQEGAEKLVTQVANSIFVPLAKLPYNTAKPEEAAEWVQSHIDDSYAVEPKEKTSNHVGLATINIFGSPLFRTLELDFGFANSTDSL